VVQASGCYHRAGCGSHKLNDCYAILSEATRVGLVEFARSYLAVGVARAGMAELADAVDSKSAEGNLVGVRPPLPAPTNT
jgi:hypothetical protein